MTSTAVLRTVLLDDMRTDSVVLVRSRRMPVLSGPVLADADGILGIKGLSRFRIDIDLEHGTETIARSPGVSAEGGACASCP